VRRVLVAYGSKRGGTAEIAEAIAAAMRERGLEVDCRHAAEVSDVGAYDAVIAGGALYMFRWVREARRFVARHAHALRGRPVWM
jgi:menaquinone-dependent protoporphyrinogen oxidase